MKIRITEDIKIALDGFNVVSLKAGDVLENPHADVLECASFVHVEDEATEDEATEETAPKSRKGRRN